MNTERHTTSDAGRFHVHVVEAERPLPRSGHLAQPATPIQAAKLEAVHVLPDLGTSWTRSSPTGSTVKAGAARNPADAHVFHVKHCRHAHGGAPCGLRRDAYTSAGPRYIAVHPVIGQSRSATALPRPPARLPSPEAGSGA